MNGSEFIGLCTNPYNAYKHKRNRVSGSEDDSSLHLSSGQWGLHGTSKIQPSLTLILHSVTLCPTRTYFVKLYLYPVSTDISQTLRLRPHVAGYFERRILFL